MQVRQLRRQLERTQPEGAGQRLEEVYRFIGNVEQALLTVSSGSDATAAARIAALEQEVATLGSNLDAPERRDAQRAAMLHISVLIKDHADFMGIGQGEGAPTLDVRDLNVKFLPIMENGQDAYLWQIGSGENWMGYHIATFLALHEYLLTRRDRSPVPSFLVIDQPSQVFFPSDSYDDAVSAAPDADAQADLRQRRRRDPDHDLQRTKRIFETIGRWHQRIGHAVQVIVLEHADATAWGHVPEFQQVGNWRGPDTDWLIPRDWLHQDAT